MKSVELEIDEARYRVRYEAVEGVLWIHCNGETWTYSPPKKKGRRSAAGHSDFTGDLRAPMPGKIVKIAVGAGTRVSVGDTVLVMEAMKMEYILKSPAQGVVTQVLKSEGQQVALDEKLVLIQDDESTGSSK